MKWSGQGECEAWMGLWDRYLFSGQWKLKVNYTARGTDMAQRAATMTCFCQTVRQQLRGNNTHAMQGTTAVSHKHFFTILARFRHVWPESIQLQLSIGAASATHTPIDS